MYFTPAIFLLVAATQAVALPHHSGRNKHVALKREDAAAGSTIGQPPRPDLGPQPMPGEPQENWSSGITIFPRNFDLGGPMAPTTQAPRPEEGNTSQPTYGNPHPNQGPSPGEPTKPVPGEGNTSQPTYGNPHPDRKPSPGGPTSPMPGGGDKPTYGNRHTEGWRSLEDPTSPTSPTAGDPNTAPPSYAKPPSGIRPPSPNAPTTGTLHRGAKRSARPKDPNSSNGASGESLAEVRFPDDGDGINPRPVAYRVRRRNPPPGLGIYTGGCPEGHMPFCCRAADEPNSSNKGDPCNIRPDPSKEANSPQSPYPWMKVPIGFFKRSADLVPRNDGRCGVTPSNPSGYTKAVACCAGFDAGTGSFSSCHAM